MEIIKLFALAIGFALTVSYLKHIGSDLYHTALIGSGIVLVIAVFNLLSESISGINEFFRSANIDNGVLSSILKAVGIGYLTEFTANAIDDLGVKSLSDKVILAGKFAIIAVSLPIIINLIKILTNIIK